MDINVASLKVRLASVAGIAAVLALSVACGSSSPTEPESQAPVISQTTTITYSGTFQSSVGSYGSVTLTAAVPALTAADTGMAAPKAVASATGTLKPGGGGAIPLTGTYDTVDRKFTLTGSGFSVSATVTTSTDGETVNGSVTMGTTAGTLVAVPPPPTGTLTTFCGNYTGDTSGTLVMVRKDNKLFALVAENGAPADFSIVGTITGTSVLFKFDYAPPDVGSTTVIGTISGGVISGTWQANYIEPGRGPVVERGDWVVRAGSCPL